MPAGMRHFVRTQGDTVVQLHGVGPWAITYVNPADDPRTRNNRGRAQLVSTSRATHFLRNWIATSRHLQLPTRVHQPTARLGSASVSGAADSSTVVPRPAAPKACLVVM